MRNRTMRNKILAILAFISIATSLQASENSSVGCIRLGYIQDLLPAYKVAASSYQSFEKQIAGPLQDKYQDFVDKSLAYAKDQETMTDAVKNQKDAELKQLSSELNALGRIAASKREELFGPIDRKIQQAIEKVAQERGYRCILLKNEHVVYASKECDISDLVLETLKDEEVSSTQEKDTAE